jgi:hypothetical protein
MLEIRRICSVNLVSYLAILGNAMFGHCIPRLGTFGDFLLAATTVPRLPTTRMSNTVSDAPPGEATALFRRSNDLAPTRLLARSAPDLIVLIALAVFFRSQKIPPP